MNTCVGSWHRFDLYPSYTSWQIDWNPNYPHSNTYNIRWTYVFIIPRWRLGFESSTYSSHAIDAISCKLINWNVSIYRAWAERPRRPPEWRLTPGYICLCRPIWQRDTLSNTCTRFTPDISIQDILEFAELVRFYFTFCPPLTSNTTVYISYTLGIMLYGCVNK